MVTNIDDLEALLAELGDELPDAEEAEKRSLAAELPLAKTMLQKLIERINEKIALTERNFIEKFPTSVESPVISLVKAVLIKRRYKVDTQGDTSYTQFIVRW